MRVGKRAETDLGEASISLSAAAGTEKNAGVWPSGDYLAQVAALRKSVGQLIYLAESRLPESLDGFRMTDTPVELLGVVEFPRPDPARGLLPHLILLADGRGVNLGRVARISLSRAFNPAPEQLLYRQPMLLEQALFGQRRLSRQSIAYRAKELLGQLLGYAPERALPKPSDNPEASHEAEH